MIEKMVGERGFEPPTLCSQSRQETHGISGFGVNRGENRVNLFSGLRIPCKPFAALFIPGSLAVVVAGFVLGVVVV